MSFTYLDDYDDALSKLKRAEDTSDIQTDAEETGGKKRKVTKPQRLLLESSDEEEVRQVPAPPKIRRTLFVDGNFFNFYDVINDTIFEILKTFF